MEGKVKERRCISENTGKKYTTTNEKCKKKRIFRM